MFYYSKIVYLKRPRGPRKPMVRLTSTIERPKFEWVLNYKKDPTDERDFQLASKYKSFGNVLARVPNKVDHTPDMTPVRDQGYLGSCVGFAVTAMKEWQEAKEHEAELAEGKKDHRKGKVYDLSEAWVYWNAKKIDPWPGEEGTSIRFAMKVLNRLGVPTEKGWPYDDVNIGEPKPWATLVAKWSWIADYWRVSTLEELKVALSKGPVPIGIPCFEEIFYVGSDGVIPYPMNPDNIYGGHAVCAVGYDDDKKLVKFKNSWGKYWGKGGYGYINYAYVNDFLWDAWACNDIRVRKSMLKETKSLYG
jgi:C1A family cysteine protease